MALAAPSASELALTATALDPDFYLGVYDDVAEAGIDPVQHYVHGGWREGRDPAPWFSTSLYLAENPDIAALGLNPFAHYLAHGEAEARPVRPSAKAGTHLRRKAASPRAPWRYHTPPAPEPVAPLAIQARTPPAGEAVLSAARAVIESEFDGRYYLSENPDVAASGVDPLTHFLEAGCGEGRDPAPWFSVRDYLELNPDVAAAGMNPFVHYVQAGRAEGRPARLDLGFRHRIIADLPSLSERLAEAARHDKPCVLGTAETLTEALSQTRSGLSKLHLTVSHDDYTANLGGVQLCLQREAAAAEAEGFDHLHLFPLHSRPMLRRPGEASPLGVIWNGRTLGGFEPQVVAGAVAARLAGTAVQEPCLAIHSLLGHSLDDVLAVIAAAGLKGGWFWVHDFAAACASYHLLRNDVADCGAPPPESQACALCVYGEARSFHRAEHHRLFEALELSVAAPSAVALETWLRGAGLNPRRSVVAPLAEITPRARPQPAPEPLAAAEGPFRFAFPGLPGTLKGWPVFRELVLRFADDPRYRFLHLGRDATGLPAAFHRVAVSADQPQAMRQMIEDQAVDAVLVWSLCRETFSFTTHEAAAAGAAVLTGPDSGNVAAFVQATGQGLVLPDEAALFELFASGAVLDLARTRRGAQSRELSFSRLTFDLAAEDPA